METAVSKRFPIKCGVPQGSVLGPLLYLIMISDIQVINDLPKIIYADDTNCVVSAKTSDDLKIKSEAAMSDLVEYYHSARLKLNAEKTEVINFDSKLNVVSVMVDAASGLYQDSVLHARMLGVQIDNALDFKQHIDNVVRDVKQRIKQLQKLPKGVTLKARRMMGIGIVLSKIFFGLPVYASASKSDLVKVKVAYHDALRAILGVNKMMKVKMSYIRRTLQLLSFDSLVRYFDVTTLQRILVTGQPYHLFKYVDLRFLF